MADLIERDELRKDFCNMCEVMQPEMVDCPKKGCISMQIINEQPAVNRWIPCSERLPDCGKDVVVYTKAWEEHIQIAHILCDGIMWELSDGEFYFSMFDVTHWMPLPSPPESEVQE